MTSLAIASGTTIVSGQTVTDASVSVGDSLTVDLGGAVLGLSGGGSVIDSGLVTDLQDFSGSIEVESGGSLSGGTLVSADLIVFSGGTADGLSLTAAPDASFSYNNDGGVMSTTVVGSGARLSNSGTDTDTILNAGTLIDFSTATDTGVTVGAGALMDDAGSTNVSNVLVASGGTLDVLSGGVVQGISLAIGGILELDAFFYQSSDTFSFNYATDLLTLVTSAGTITEQFSGSYVGEFFHLGADAAFGLQVTVDGSPCYCTGTLIQTDRGDVPVEHLVAGDLVVTASGACRPIRWIGRRSYAARFASRNPDVVPVTFRAGSLGCSLPRRDLRVSPRHAMFIDGLLVPASALLGLPGVLEEPVLDVVGYHHIELDTHDVIFAEGTMSETFVDDGSRGMFQNAAEWRLANPDAPIVPPAYCAPRVEDGAALEAVRARLEGLAAAAHNLGQARLSDRSPGRGASATVGFVDEVTRCRVRGWAVPLDPSEPFAFVRIVVDGVTVGRTEASGFRHDLMAAGIGQGRHAFEFDLPFVLDADRSQVVSVVRACDGVEIPMPERAFSHWALAA